MLSVVITTMNEEANIALAVRGALLLSDDVLVMDSGSTDKTRQIALDLGARVMTRAFDDMARQRNAALDDGELRYPHALVLDADELVTPAFANALLALLEAHPELDGVRICRKFHFWGRWVPSASSFPRYIDRVVRLKTTRFRKDGHGEVFDGGAHFVNLEAPLHDEDHKGIGAWIARHNRYAELEAKRDRELRRGKAAWTSPPWIRAVLRDVPGFPVAMGAYYLLARGGLWEGREGRTYGVMKAVYEYLIQLHARDLERRAGSSAAKLAEPQR